MKISLPVPSCRPSLILLTAWIANESPRRGSCAKIVEIVMVAIRKADELLRLTRQRKQPFAEHNWNRGIACAMHDQQSRLDPRDAQVGAERIPHQPTHRKDRKGGSANID